MNTAVKKFARLTFETAFGGLRGTVHLDPLEIESIADNGSNYACDVTMKSGGKFRIVVDPQAAPGEPSGVADRVRTALAAESLAVGASGRRPSSAVESKGGRS